MKLLSGCMFFIIAMSSQSFADDIPAEEKFNEKTGELYWDLGSNIRIEYVPQCKLSRPGNYYLDSSGFRRFMKDLDYFGIISLDDLRVLDCDSRGLSYRNLLKQDGYFPVQDGSFPGIGSDGISWGGGRIEDLYELSNYRRRPSDNFDPVYSALQVGAIEIAVDIYGRADTGFIYNDLPYASYLVNLSNLEGADRLSKILAVEKSEDISRTLYIKYFLITLINLAFFALIFVVIFAYKAKLHPKIVKGVKFFYKKISKLIFRKEVDGAQIIKNENLRSYSVADELLKWAKLKEDGLISEEEFKKAREKIMGKH